MKTTVCSSSNHSEILEREAFLHDVRILRNLFADWLKTKQMMLNKYSNHNETENFTFELQIQAAAIYAHSFRGSYPNKCELACNNVL